MGASFPYAPLVVVPYLAYYCCIATGNYPLAQPPWAVLPGCYIAPIPCGGLFLADACLALAKA